MEHVHKISKILAKHPVFKTLHRCFGGIIAGTYPLGLNTEGSDVDIVLHHKPTGRTLLQYLGWVHPRDKMEIKAKTINDRASMIIRFKMESYPFELFAQDLETTKQDAYRHMMVEREFLLKDTSGKMKNILINYKKEGLSTEAAFVKILQLKGDPYKALLKL